jgi:protein Tex
MILEGTVTNVTNFGAFVDIGVHQDGLVHISMLSNKFVKDPHEIVKAGEVVKVKVLEVDEKRKRIALTMRLEDQAARRESGAQQKREPQKQGPQKHSPRPAPRASSERPQSVGGGAMAEALANALKRGH